MLLAGTDNELLDSVKKYESLEKELNEILHAKKQSCLPLMKPDPQLSYCSLKNLCSMKDIHIDDPILYQNEKGEKIINDKYFKTREDMRSCLKEKYKTEILDQRDELTTKLETKHLKKILAANNNLNKLAGESPGEREKIQKVSAEILTMSLESGLNGEVSNWDMTYVKKNDLSQILSAAEKRLKLNLKPEIKRALIEIQYLKKNPLYLKEIEAFEKALIPEVKTKDPFYDWEFFIDEKKAGGKIPLEANRALLAKKTEEAYDLFKDVQMEMLGYLDTKKNIPKEKLERIKERIKTLKFSPPRLTLELKEHCSYPNAYYSSIDHSVTVCPQMLNYPKMALVEALAHEITHNYDSCFLSGNVYKVAGPEEVLEAPFEIDIKMDRVPGNYRITLEDTPVKAPQKVLVQNKQFFSEHPFYKTLSCLEGAKSVGAQPIKLNEMVKKNKELLHELSLLGRNVHNNNQAKYLNYFNGHQEEFFNYYQGCNNSDAGDSMGRSQLQEAFADKMASEIIAIKLKKFSKEEADKAVLEIALANGNICPNEGRDAGAFRDLALKEKCPNYFENKSLENKILTALEIIDPKFDPHIAAAKGIERNLLAHPDIRKSLQCPVDAGVKYCE